uniref:Ig-like domain-containing protein n=1 Tax=Cyprinus carpio TaxID=7962 RepID=A0A8C1YPS0_CYPCA
MIFTLLFTLIIFVLSGVFGADDRNEIKSISVMKGDSVTLHTDVTEVQRDDLILWTFGSQDNLIAEIHKQFMYLFDGKESFRNSLQMEQKTGSLTVANMRPEHSGLYQLTAIIRGRTSYKTFNVTVSDTLEISVTRLPVPVISSNPSQCSSSSSSSQQNCSLVCSVLNVSHVTLSWYKGNSLLSSISVSDLSISLSLPLEVEYQDKNSYSCVLNNPISNQTQHLDITQLCHTCSGNISALQRTEGVKVH